MYVVTVNFFIKSDAVENFVAAVLKNAKISVAVENDCHQFDVCQADDNQSEIFLYEVYSSKAAFDLHMKSSHFAEFNSLVSDWVVKKEISIFEKL